MIPYCGSNLVPGIPPDADRLKLLFASELLSNSRQVQPLPATYEQFSLALKASGLAPKAASVGRALLGGSVAVGVDTEVGMFVATEV
jgi:hypothetical protein